MVRLPVLRERVGVDCARDFAGVDRVQSREEAAEVVDEVFACTRVLLVAQDPARECLALDVGHHEPRRAEHLAVVVDEDFRHRQARPPARAHRVGFELHRPGQPGATGRIAPEDERAAAGGE